MTNARQPSGKTAGPWVDIDLGALCANYAMLRKAAPGAEIAAVVKCDAYGLGAERISRALSEREQARIFFVAYPEEGVVLRNALDPIDKDATIYVFNGPSPETIDHFKTSGLIPVLNTIEQATFWTSAAPGEEAGLHIDTGMNRLGAPMGDVDLIASLPGLNVTMVMSHLACSSDPKDEKNKTQRDLFAGIAQKFPKALKSLSASGGAMMDESYHFDLIRPGIALYGGSPFDVDDRRITPVAALRAPVLQIRHSKPGETVGYGATYELKEHSILATVALGYGDGLQRAFSSKGEAVINGERARITGRVSMDLVTLDVTNLKNPAKPGDIAEFFGPNLPIHEAASVCNTIPYELLTGLGGRVDRRYL